MKEKQPERILNYLYCEVWKHKDIVRDHSHADMANWIDEPPQDGKIKTVCRKCGDFIGNRRQFNGERGWKSRRKRRWQLRMQSRG